MLFQILVIVILIWMLNLRRQKQVFMKTWDQLRNNLRTLPLLGHAYLFFGSDEDRMNIFRKIGVEAYATGGLFALWQGSRLYINISDPIEADFILKNCLEKDDVMKCSRLLTGNGSVFAPVSIWRPRRKLLAPTFSPKNLTNFVDIFSKQSEIMVDQLREAVGKGTFSIWKYITTYSMDSVCESTLGVCVNSQLQSDLPFLKAFEEICKMDSARICQPWFHNDTVYKMTPYYKRHTVYRNYIFDFISKIIKDKRKSMAEEQNKTESEQESKRKTFLELLIESTKGQQGYTDLELREETMVLVLAGTDTSAVGTAFAAVMLSRFPEVQEKVYQEVKEVFGDSDRPLTAEDLPHLKYLEAVVRETVRLFPPVPVIVRKVFDDNVTLPSSGITLVKNTGIAVNIWAINRNPMYWGEDSMKFKPERFLDLTPKEAASFMAFSHGPRSCLGYQYAMMSMKTAVALLVRKYKILPADPLADKCSDMRIKFDIMMKDVDNFPVKLETRVH